MHIRDLALLSCVAAGLMLSSGARAASVTLQELIDTNGTVTSGNLTFSGFAYSAGSGIVMLPGADKINVDSVTDGIRFTFDGFVVSNTSAFFNLSYIVSSPGSLNSVTTEAAGSNFGNPTFAQINIPIQQEGTASSSTLQLTSNSQSGSLEHDLSGTDELRLLHNLTTIEQAQLDTMTDTFDYSLPTVPVIPTPSAVAGGLLIGALSLLRRKRV